EPTAAKADANGGQQPAAQEAADDADDDVEQDALLAVGAHDQAGKPAGDSADDQVDDEIHCSSKGCFAGSAAPVWEGTRDGGVGAARPFSRPAQAPGGPCA